MVAPLPGLWGWAMVGLPPPPGSASAAGRSNGVTSAAYDVTPGSRRHITEPAIAPHRALARTGRI